MFILNASWRLLGDRFYTDDYRPEVYTPEGLEWVDRADMKSVLLGSASVSQDSSASAPASSRRESRASASVAREESRSGSTVRRGSRRPSGARLASHGHARDSATTRTPAPTE